MHRLTLRTERPGHAPIRRWSSVVVSILLFCTSITAFTVVQVARSPKAAATTPGSPGTPQAGTTVYSEDFENKTDASVGALNTYTGAAAALNETYTANAAWLPAANSCNGIVLSQQSPASNPTPSNNCQTGGWAGIRNLAGFLGQFAFDTGETTTNTATTNDAVSAYTQANPGANLVQFQTVNPIPVTVGHYYTLQADTAAEGCQASAPTWTMQVVSGGVTTNVTTTPYNVCTSATKTYPDANSGDGLAHVGTLTGTAPLLATSSSLTSIKILNTNGSGTGNDGAFDNIRLVDVTPQLDKAFSPSTITAGGTSTLTFTVTNTTDLGAKSGFQFTDTLPAGLAVASTPAYSTTCTSTTASGNTAGSTAMTLKGSMAAGVSSCTFKINVTAPTAGSYTNSATNITATTGLNPPGSATLTVNIPPPTFTLTKSASPTSTAPGGKVTYTLAIKNTSVTAYTVANPASFSDSLAGVLDDATYNNDASTVTPGWTFSGSGPITGTGPIAAGATVTVTYSVTVNDPDTGNKSLVNTVTPTATGGTCTGGVCTTTTTVNPPIACAPGTIYGSNATQILSINNTTGAGTVLATFSGVTSQLNALAVTKGGKAAYGIDQTVATTSGQSPKILRYDSGTLTTSSFTGTPIGTSLNASGFLRGGINLSNGIYYYSGTRADNTTQDIYAFNTVTNTPIGYIGSLNGVTGGNGDLTFDANGNMFLVVSNGDATNNKLIRIANVPTTAGTAVLTGTTIATLPANISENGITFDGDGYLYASTGTTLYKLNPNSGALVSSVAFSGVTGSVTDLADCEVNGSLSLQKNIVARSGSTDQFTMTITGGGATTNNTGTTTGSTTGQQTAASATAGPVVGIPGTVYTLTETAASGSLTNYGTTLSCIDQANGNAPVAVTPVGGSTTSYTLTFPTPATQSTPLANVVCTMSNSANPTIKLTKTLSGNRVNAGDQFTVQIHTGSPTGPVVNSTASSTTTGSGSTVTAGTGTTGTFTGTAGTTYYLTEAAAGTTALTDYTNQAITCTDANGQQTGLPSGAAFSGSLAIPLVAGAAISCTLTNTPNTPNLQLTKTASPTTVSSTSDTVTYSFLVKNTGNVTVTGLVIADSFVSPSSGTAPTITCPTQTLAPGASTTCTGTYSVKQADLDNGVINNSATAGALDPSGKTVTSNPSTATVSATQTGTLTIVKSASPGTVTTIGQSVAYSFLVKNTGNVTLSGVAVADTFTAPAGPALVITCPTTTLAPGASTTCTAPYAATAADFNRGRIDNSASASGKTPGNVTVTSAPSTATVTTTQSPAIKVTKSATPSTVSTVGQTVSYSFVVLNTGNVTLTSVSVADSFTAPAGPPLTISCPATTLAAGASTTCTASYSVTQADLDAGTILNSATATGTPPVGGPVTSAPSTATVSATQTATLTIVKSASPGTVTTIGQSVAYSFLVKNTGNVTLTGLAVADTFTAPAGPALVITCPTTTLAPGASTTCTAPYSATAADFNRGRIDNSASVSGKTPGNVTVTSAPSTATVTTTQSPAIKVTKSGTPTTVTTVGQTVAYSFVVLNTGNVTLTSVSVADTFTAPAGPPLTINCPATTLAAGASTTCTASYSVKQADLDAGTILNSATATGTPPVGSPVTSAPSTATVTATQSGALTIVKSASPGTVSAIGQGVSYSFLVTNNGNVTLTNVALADTFTAPAGPALVITCPTTTLAPGASTTCTAPYTATAADFNRGRIDNSATVSGQTPGGSTVTSTPSTATVTTTQTPTITVTKSATPGTVTTVGQTVSYSFLVTNTGNVTLTSVSVADTFTAPAGPPLSITCPATTLAAGASTTCTASYSVKQADLDAGTILNRATATGTPPAGAPVTSSPSTATVNATAAPSLQLTKSAVVTDVNGNGKTDLGDTIAWSFLLKNNGNVTLTSPAVSDPVAGTVTCPAGPLAPGGSVTCTAAPHVISQADVDAGVVNNTATATATSPGGGTVTSNPSSTTTPVGQAASLQLTKSAVVTDLNGDGKTDLGDRITWSFAVQNIGTTTLSTVAVTDPVAGTVTCPPGPLGPGATVTCTAAPHVISQADVDAGVVNNTATATAKTPSNATVTSNPSSTSTPVVQAPALTLTKSAVVTDVNADGKTDLGDTIAWSFAVQNTGTTTITNVAVTDPKAGTVTCPAGPLAPGDTATCTAAAYVITQADVDAGVVSNTAIASGTDPTGTTVPSNPSSTDTPVVQVAVLQLTKSAITSDVNGDFKIDLGDTITWSFAVKNTGTTTITNVAVTDPTAGAVTCPAGPLAPGATVTCTAAPHVITQADVDAGVVSNTATATGKNPSGGTVTSNPSSTDTPVAQSPALTLTKTAAVTDVNGDGKTDLGDTITWSFAVQNTGTTTITDVAVTDPVAGTVSCPVTILAPNQSTTCPATTAHTVTQADVDAGVVSNTATATGKSPSGGTVTSNPSSTDTPVAQAPALTLTKSAAVTDVDGDGHTDLGDTIAWSFAVQNSGTTTITSPSVTDPVAGTVTCPAGPLAPGDTVTCSAAPHTITQADVDAGVVSNTATAHGTDSKGNPVTSNQSSTDTPVAQVSTLQLTKSAVVTDVDGDGKTDLGDAITWSFAVQNTGTTTITNVAVNDPVAGAVTCPAGPLAPGATATCTAVPHTISQGDVDAGVVSNTAIASGTDPTGTTVPSNPSSTDTPIAQASTLQLIKSAMTHDLNGDFKIDLGDTITWSFAVQNTGTTTITNVAVADPTAGAVTCPTGPLAPGATVTCTATTPHTITQADVDAGIVSNTATATGKNPSGGPVTSNPSSTDTPVAQVPGLTLTKTAAVTDVDGDGKTDLGDTITWSFAVQNTGTTTITNVAVTDPVAGAVTCPAGSLAPGDIVTCTAVAHVITQTDVDAGVVSNTATASGRDPQGNAVPSNPSSTDTPVAQAPALTLTKSAAVTDVDGDGKTNLGDTITWSFAVQNTGTTTITSPSVTDLVAGTVTCPAGPLAPGATVTCTAAPHTITQADVDAGVVSNTATAHGTDSKGNPVTSNQSSTDTPVAQVSTLQLTKSAVVTDVDGDGKTDLGDAITWSFAVQNTGTTTITNLAVNDPVAGTVTCPAGPLGPGATVTCTAVPHTISQGDVDAGVVSNTAIASGTDPTGTTVPSNPSSTDTPIARTSTLELTKSAVVTDVDGDGKTGRGDTITWSFAVQNTGTTTITNLAVSDPVAGAVSCPVTTLAPGATATCTAAVHTITQADVDAGVVSNTAAASGRDPQGNPVPSNSSSTDTPIVQSTGLSLTKSATVTDVDGDGKTDLGDTVAWSFLVTNTGTTTLTGLAVTDPTAGAVTCPVTTLAPGASTTCTAATPHTVTQADVDAGVVSNTAIAAGTDPNGVSVPSNPSSTDTPITQSTGLSLTKSAHVNDLNNDGRTDLGDTISWSFLLTNSGTTTLTGLAVVDPTAGAVTCPTAPLAPGASVTCTATTPFTVTQTDVDAGVVNNTATASGTDPNGVTVPSNSSSTSTPVFQRPVPELTKSATVTDVNGDGKTDLGDVVNWSFFVDNDGNVTLNIVLVTDPTAGAVTCPTTTLLPGESMTCTAAPHVIDQSDVDRGFVANTAFATAQTPLGETVRSNDSSTDTPVAQAPALQLTKSAAVTDVDGDGKTDLGDTIAWSFALENTGTTTITNLTVTDPVAGAVTCPLTTVAPGDTVTCTADAVHPITQADVDAGVVSNTATASGQDPSGDPVPSNSSSTDTPVAQAPALQLTKSATVTDVDGDGKTDLGDTIAWSFLVENSGTTTITDLAVTDPTAGAVTCPVTTLAPGASTTCVATTPHTVTQADVDAGVVSNTATAAGTDPNGAAVPSNSSSTDTPVDRTSTLDLTKSAVVTDVDGDGQTDLGDTIAWSFAVQNTGTTTITDLAVSDPTAGAVTCPTTTLAPGASVTCTAAVHRITQADVDAGVVTNTATAAGQDPQGNPVPSNPSSTDTPVVRSSGLQLTKTATTADVNGDFKIDLGDTITWSFALENTGTTTLTGLSVTDPTAGAVTCPSGPLAPGATVTCTADVPHTITQADVDAGVVSNTATASGQDPSGDPVPSNSSSTDTPVAQAPALQLTKSAVVTDVDGDGKTDLGDTIAWSFALENTGTTTITNLTVTDPVAGAVTCPVTTVAPGDTVTCTADAVHPITQADVDAGVVSNTATASGQDPSGDPVPSNSSSTDTPVTQAPALTLTKSAAVTDVDGDGKTDLGDTIAWSFLVTNTGTTTLTTVAVADPTAGAVTCPVTTLTPGASTTCQATTPHVITQADVDAGFVDNTATASGLDPTSATVPSNSSSTHTTVASASSLLGTKHATVNDLNHDGRTDLGDTITYTVTVQNTGTVTLHGISVTDPKAGAITCLATTLAPGATTTCTATTAYSITQADVDAGHVDNTATAHALDPAGDPVDAPPSSVSTPVTATSALQLVKHASAADTNGDGHLGAGDRITWTFALTNTGSRTLTGITVTDPTAGSVTCPVTTLAPGASTTCQADNPHVITQADVDNGDVTNTATADGTDSLGDPVHSSPSSTDTALAQVVGLRLTKTGVPTDANHDGKVDAGDTIQWTFTVTNTGLVTLTGVTVSDPKAAPVTCAATILAPGASTTCTADNPYPITSGDVSNGVVHNVATATGGCGCAANVLPAKAAAVVPTASSPASVVPGLPFTGAMGVVWAVRGGLAFLVAGAFLILIGRRRRTEDEPNHQHRAL